MFSNITSDGICHREVNPGDPCSVYLLGSFYWGHICAITAWSWQLFEVKPLLAGSAVGCKRSGLKLNLRQLFNITVEYTAYLILFNFYLALNVVSK